MKKILLLLAIILIIVIIIIMPIRSKEVLYVFNWTDYIAPELIKKFERQHNCRIKYDTYNSNENMLTKLKTTNVAYDIIVPSGDHLSILIEQDMLEKLDKTLLTNYHNLDPQILQKAYEYETSSDYGVPYFWGTCGIIYNKQYVSDEDMEEVSWDILADERFEGKAVISLLEDFREVIGVALIYNGFDPNDSSEEALQLARETLLRWSPNIAQFDSDSFKNEVQDGTIWLGQAYNGDALQVIEENDDVGFAFPVEGSTLWIDFLVIPKNSQNKELAHKFINFLLEENVAFANEEYVQYPTPNQAAYQLLSDEIKENSNIYPSDNYLQKCFLIKNIGNEILKFDQIWQEIRF